MSIFPSIAQRLLILILVSARNGMLMSFASGGTKTITGGLQESEQRFQDKVLPGFYRIRFLLQ